MVTIFPSCAFNTGSTESAFAESFLSEALCATPDKNKNKTRKVKSFFYTSNHFYNLNLNHLYNLRK